MADRNTTQRKGSLNLLTTETGEIPEYFINGIPIIGNLPKEVTGNYQLLITDINIVIVGPATLTLIEASTAIHSLSIKSKLPGGDITVTPFAGDTINAATTLVIPAGAGQTIAPITLDWEVMG